MVISADGREIKLGFQEPGTNSFARAEVTVRNGKLGISRTEKSYLEAVISAANEAKKPDKLTQIIPKEDSARQIGMRLRRGRVPRSGTTN